MAASMQVIRVSSVPWRTASSCFREDTHLKGTEMADIQCYIDIYIYSIDTWLVRKGRCYPSREKYESDT